MRIGMILDSTFPPDPRVENEAVSLIEKGHEVFLFCLNYNSRPARETIRGIHVYRASAGKLLYKLSALAYTVPFYHQMLARKVRKFLQETPVDALHVHDIQSARAVVWANRKLQRPLVLDLHENRPEIMKYYQHVCRFPGNLLIYPSLWKRREHQLVKKANHVVVVTREAKQHLVTETGISPEKVSVVPNTVLPSFYKDYKPDHRFQERFRNRFVLFYFGETGLRRGLESAVRAVALLKKDIPDILLLIVGKSKTDGYLKELARRLDIEDNVCLDGWQDPSLLHAYIEASDVCISPLLRNIHHDTTYANKLFQYMALGKPVLVSDCPAQQTIVEEAHAGLVHKAGDETDLATKVKILYLSAEDRRTMGQNGQKFVRKYFNWTLCSRELQQLYDNL